MLKGIPKIISPELMNVLMNMGHGDEIVIADGNFPSATCAQNLVDASGHGVPELLDAILRFFPLDTFVKHPAGLMQTVDAAAPRPQIWKEFETVVRRHEPDFPGFEMIERFEFYERAKDAFAVIATGETAVYANIILKKGVVLPSMQP